MSGRKLWYDGQDWPTHRGRSRLLLGRGRSTLRLGRTASGAGAIALFLFLRVALTAGDALMVTLHAVNTMTGFGKHEFVDTIVTGTTFEAVGVVRVVTGHDGFVKDGLLTNATAV